MAQAGCTFAADSGMKIGDESITTKTERGMTFFVLCFAGIAFQMICDVFSAENAE
jgi:hypothetical protein